MLRSLEELHGYTIHATDGDIGTVYAFFFDDKTWAIRYLVVDTGNWLPDRQVLISPIALGQPDWEGQFFSVKLTTEQVRNSPDIDTDKPVSRQQETLLHTYYDWPTYWSGGIPLGPHAAAAYPGGLPMTEPYEPSQEMQGHPLYGRGYGELVAWQEGTRGGNMDRLCGLGRISGACRSIARSGEGQP